MLKNVTLSAEETLIEAARARALEEHKTLNALFRGWLSRYARGDRGTFRYEDLMTRLSYAKPVKAYSRDEMNER
jgi:hypothetical protein